MEKQMVMTDSRGVYLKMANLYKSIISIINTPLRLLAGYYAAVLERDINDRQARALTEVQLAFFAFILPADYSLLLREAACVWCFVALKKCRALL